jgi:hypothetical protein
MELEGNCLLCIVDQSLAFQACVREPALSPEDVSACLTAYMVDVSVCSP